MNRVITGEIDKTLIISAFSAFEAGIWVSRAYIDENDESGSFWVDGFGGNLDDLINIKIVISSMIVGSTIFAKMLSLSDLRLIDDNAFYWDNASQDLYVKFTDLIPWYLQKSIRAGETVQFSTKAQSDSNGKPTDSVIGGLVYSPRVREDSINSSREEDKLRKNKMKFNDFSFDIINEDGELDSIRSEVINLGSRIKLAEVENGSIVTDSDLVVIRNGFIKNVSFPNDKIARITCSDPRDIFNNKVGTEKLDQTEFTDLKDSLVDKFKPLAIGNLTNIPTVRLEDTNLEPNDGDSGWTDSIDFLIGSTTHGNITSVSNVYLNGSLYIRNASEGRWDKEVYSGDIPLTLTTDYTFNASTGILTIKRFGGGKISCDCVGTKPTSTDKIIDYLFWFLEEFAGIAYIESFFNTDEVNIIRDRASNYTGGIYIGVNGMELKQVIDMLTGSINTYLVEQEERYTMRDLFVDPITTETHVIQNYELKKTPSRDYDTDRYMSSILAKYDKDWTDQEFSTSLDDSQETEAIIANSLQFTYEFETLVDNKTDADAVSSERYDIDPPLHLNMDFNSTLGFKLYDYILYELQRRNGTIIEPYSLYRVVSIDEANRKARLRWIEVADSSEEIPEIASTPYQQGFLDNDRLFNDNLYSNTQGA